jgi:hypothetical protein
MMKLPSSTEIHLEIMMCKETKFLAELTCYKQHDNHPPGKSKQRDGLLPARK